MHVPQYFLVSLVLVLLSSYTASIQSNYDQQQPQHRSPENSSSSNNSISTAAFVSDTNSRRQLRIRKRRARPSDLNLPQLKDIHRMFPQKFNISHHYTRSRRPKDFNITEDFLKRYAARLADKKKVLERTDVKSFNGDTGIDFVISTYDEPAVGYIKRLESCVSGVSDRVFVYVKSGDGERTHGIQNARASSAAQMDAWATASNKLPMIIGGVPHHWCCDEGQVPRIFHTLLATIYYNMKLNWHLTSVASRQPWATRHEPGGLNYGDGDGDIYFN